MKSMLDIYYYIETKELLDTSAADIDAAIRSLHLSVGATWCECHSEQIFHSTAPLTEHLLAHDRILGFSIIHFDNAVLAWSPERPVSESFDPVSGKRILQKTLPDSPEELKKCLT